MKAIVLVGGKGERAKPFSEVSPKVMIPVNGRPVIDYVVRHLVSFNFIDEAIMVCSGNEDHTTQVKSYFEGKEKLFNNKIRFIDESLGGTGGAVLSAKPFLKDQNEFLVWFGDNLIPLDIDALHSHYKARSCIGCVTVSSTRKTETGFVEVAPDGKILKFKEKPTIKLTEPECLGIYLFNTKILNYIEKAAEQQQQQKKNSVNLSYDVLEKLPSHEKLHSYDIGQTDWIDAESPTKLARNTDRVKAIIEKMSR
ncbi:MAG: nucleotidyltransferase family protein [Thaumarchaeota archaeon]|nr:nucleotidyltransferase family protein [Nitrososphaerota archaeon]MCL5318592.1 nucleotidyltransferase family protein [Nitrososphaerota archaeon]